MFLSHLEAKLAATKSGSTLAAALVTTVCYCPPAASPSHVVLRQSKQTKPPPIPSPQTTKPSLHYSHHGSF